MFQWKIGHVVFRKKVHGEIKQLHIKYVFKNELISRGTGNFLPSNTFKRHIPVLFF